MLPDDFNFSQFINQKIRILQSDNYVKIGILIEVNHSYIVLRFIDGNRVFIDKKVIVGLEEVK